MTPWRASTVSKRAWKASICACATGAWTTSARIDSAGRARIIERMVLMIQGGCSAAAGMAASGDGTTWPAKMDWR